MSLDADSIKKLNEFLSQLDKQGITPTQFITTMQAGGSGAAAATLIVKKLPIHPETDTSKKFHGAVLPRDGGSDPHGIWVGKGEANKGLVAKGYYCYRDLDLDHKTLSEVNKITTDCKKGLEAKPEYRFMLATEETKTKLNDTLREMETFIIDHGMESCFNIITDTDSYNAFREFGRISDEVQATWIDDILRDGVRCGLNSRYELCPYDAENMELSGEAILNSCSPALKRTIMRELPVEDRNGISVFFSAIRHGRTHTNANVRKMCNELEQMDIRKYPGENVVAFCHDALDKVDEIRLAAQQLTDLENLTQLTVQGMSIGSDEGLRNAFCQADQKDPLYVELPQYYKVKGREHEDLVLCLQKSLYGQVNSPKLFFDHISEGLDKIGFKPSDSDPCLFINKELDVMVLQYVDDQIWVAKDDANIEKCVQELKEHGYLLTIEDDSNIFGFLGIDIEKNGKEIHLSQKGLTDKVIRYLGLEKTVSKESTPASSCPLGADKDGDPFDEEWSYPAAVGMLLYLSSNTRPDIQFAVHSAARFSHAPKKSHARAVKRIVRYLSATTNGGKISRGIKFKPDLSSGLDMYVDADYAGLFGYEDDMEGTMLQRNPMAKLSNVLSDV